MPQIIGAFVFKDDGDGCLTAKWTNEGEKTSYPEASKLIDNTAGKNKFEGTYITTWVEQKNKVIDSTLTIILTSPGIYTLEWFDSNTPLFHGTAMIYGELLVGSYWD